MGNVFLLFQHVEPLPLLEVNMACVIESYIRPRRTTDIRHDLWLQEAAHCLVKDDRAIDVNWADFDFGSAICLAGSQRCTIWPVHMHRNSKGTPRSTLKCNISGGGDRFSGRMMLRIGQEVATVPVMQHGRLPCPRAIAT